MGGELVGFLGLGVMGGPMSANLVKAGFDVVGFDPDESRRKDAEAGGVALAASCAEVARKASRATVSIVRDWAQTEVAIFGPEGWATQAREGTDLIVMSTLDPTSIGRLGGRLGERGVAVVAAPVSGGRAGAEAGTLSIMAAGPREAVERNRGLFDAMGKNLFVLGDDPAAGQAAKLANQLMLAVNMLGAYEGLMIARAHGLDEQELMRLLSVSTGGSWATQNWERIRGFWQDYVPGNDLDIICKDLRSVLKEADEQELSLPMTGLAFQRIKHVWDR